MDLKQMLYFKTIVEAGTISKAAQILHMAQPPLSMQLKQLEEELNVQLLKRGHRKVEMTEAGKLFYKRSIQMLSLSEITKHEIKETVNETLRIGITSSNTALVQYIQDIFPQLTYRIYEGTTYDMLDLLNNHHIDIGIVRTPFDQSQVNVYHLPAEPMLAVGKEKFLHQSMNHIIDFQTTPLIIHQRYHALINDFCLYLDFNPFVKVLSDDCRSSIIWAKNNFGVAIIPESAIDLIDDSSLITVPLQDQQLYTNVSIITRHHEIPNEYVQSFIEQFIQNFNQNKKYKEKTSFL